MPLIYTIPGLDTGLKAELIAHAKRSLPRWYGAQLRAEEDFQAFAEMAAQNAAVLDDWDRGTDILNGEARWLDESAKDEGSLRSVGEDDAVLRERLRHPQATVTKPKLLEAVNAMLAAAGLPQTAVMVQLPHDGAYMRKSSATTAEAAGYGFLSSPRTPPVTTGFGFRCAKTPPPHSFVVILPIGTDAATKAAVEALLEKNKSGGVKASVEVGQ